MLCYNFYMNFFSNRLRELRTENKLTQKELATNLSIPIPTLSHWECGYAEPSHEDILAICKFFNVSSDYLLGRSDDLGSVILPAPIGERLTDNERTLLNWYRGLPSEKARAAFLTFISSSGEMFAAKRN